MVESHDSVATGKSDLSVATVKSNLSVSMVKSDLKDSTGKSDLSVSTGKRKSIYSDLMCIDCKEKTKQELCEECIPKYNSAKSIKYNHKTRINQLSSNDIPQISQESQITLPRPFDNDNIGDHDDSCHYDGDGSDFVASATNVIPEILKTPKTYSKRSRQYAQRKLRKHLKGSPNKWKYVHTDGIKRLPKTVRKDALQLLQSDMQSEIDEPNICDHMASLVNEYKKTYVEKSVHTYNLLTLISKHFFGKPLTYIQKLLGLVLIMPKKYKLI